jgi:hypothetical protein
MGATQVNCRQVGWRHAKAAASVHIARREPPSRKKRAGPTERRVGRRTHSLPFPNVKRIVVAALAFACLAFGLLLAGCGGESSPEATIVTPGQVVQKFKTSTGKELQRAAVPDEAWEQLGLGLNESPSEVAQYGIFSVYVGKSDHLAALGSLLRDKATKKPLDRGSDGVYWELDSNSGTWIAYKRYGSNVVLVWFSGSKTQAVDDRWRRLDRVFADLSS